MIDQTVLNKVKLTTPNVKYHFNLNTFQLTVVSFQR